MDENHKTLLLLRHAKSSWKELTTNDHDRPLNKRGKKDAPKMGKVLKKLNIKPDIIISSPAKRAIDTAELVAKHCGYNKQIETNSLLYASTPLNYLNIICTIPGEHRRALIVGHNPIIEELVKRLTNMTETIPTCTLIHINLNIRAWKLLESIDYRNINIINILKPKEIDI